MISTITLLIISSLQMPVTLPSAPSPGFIEITIKSEPETRNTAERGNGEGNSEVKMQKKLADDLQTLTAPDSFRTNIISTLGLWVGGAVGEVSTSTVVCIFRCFGVKSSGYEYGDVWRQSIKGAKKIWGLEKPPQNNKPDRTEEKPESVSKPATSNKKYDFEFQPSPDGGIDVTAKDGTKINVRYGGSFRNGDKILTASIDPTGKSYFKETEIKSGRNPGSPRGSTMIP